MVIPVQNIVPGMSEVPETVIPFDTPSSEGTPSSPETISSIGSPQNNSQKEPEQTPLKEVVEEPKPGKIVDIASTHVEKITTLSTDDSNTAIADKEENEFIPKVEEAHNPAHEQHS